MISHPYIINQLATQQIAAVRLEAESARIRRRNRAHPRRPPGEVARQAPPNNESPSADDTPASRRPVSLLTRIRALTRLSDAADACAPAVATSRSHNDK